MWVQSLGQEDPLEEGTATYSNILAWRISWTEELGGLQFIGSQRVGHDWSDLACMHTHIGLTILTILNVQFSGIMYLHLSGDKMVVQASMSRTLFIFPNWNSVPIKQLSSPPTLNSWGLPSYFVSMNQTTTGSSCKWNHTVFTFLWLTHFT